ncbi:hypothetical protein [Paenibacillus monticola]|uniref:Uncharacterized protein n=1 Tax=Paenibacillus monticola TaxID=2666075 RepID=A0A7X2H5T4_9BACL|nr:hypothetical protein [Paenibacillus monticola]MRN54057.1 hypothetical protein [Paenibacillus monticola]
MALTLRWWSRGPLEQTGLDRSAVDRTEMIEDYAEKQLQDIKADIESWKEISTSTDFGDESYWE